ncbi:MAG: hypothetical protein JJV89_05095 [Desulfosarcina sp.]|nr:hypothetical protein [Desulfobacterales bacterium]
MARLPGRLIIDMRNGYICCFSPQQSLDSHPTGDLIGIGIDHDKNMIIVEKLIIETM